MNDAPIADQSVAIRQVNLLNAPIRKKWQWFFFCLVYFSEIYIFFCYSFLRAAIVVPEWQRRVSHGIFVPTLYDIFPSETATTS